MIQNAESLYQTTFIEPLKAFREFFAQAEESLKKREELVEKWKALHIQVQNLQGKKYKLASHTVKLELDSRSEEISAQELKAYHAELIQLLDSVIKNRLQGIRPCVHALIMNQLDYYGNITSSRHAFGQTTTHNEEKKPTASQLESEFKNNITTELNRIKGLTIVKDHWDFITKLVINVTEENKHFQKWHPSEAEENERFSLPEMKWFHCVYFYWGINYLYHQILCCYYPGIIPCLFFQAAPARRLWLPWDDLFVFLESLFFVTALSCPWPFGLPATWNIKKSIEEKNLFKKFTRDISRGQCRGQSTAISSFGESPFFSFCSKISWILDEIIWVIFLFSSFFFKLFFFFRWTNVSVCVC